MFAARATSRTVSPARCRARVSSRPKSCWVTMLAGSAASPGDLAGCAVSAGGRSGPDRPPPAAPAPGPPWSTAMTTIPLDQRARLPPGHVRCFRPRLFPALPGGRPGWCLDDSWATRSVHTIRAIDASTPGQQSQLTGLSDFVRVLPGGYLLAGRAAETWATGPVQCAPDNPGEVWPACAPGAWVGTAARARSAYLRGAAERDQGLPPDCAACQYGAPLNNRSVTKRLGGAP